MNIRYPIYEGVYRILTLVYSVAYLTFLKKGTRKFANYKWFVGLEVREQNHRAPSIPGSI